MNKTAQDHLIRLRLLDPPADGKWGPQSQAALERFQQLYGMPAAKLDDAMIAALAECATPKVRCGSDFAGRVIRFMLAQGYWVPVGEKLYTLAYVEGVEADGSLNDDPPNEWNDRRLIIEIPQDGIPRLLGNWQATTEPGDYWTRHPMNSAGCARICFGQWAAWSVGRHGARPYEALVQVAPIKVTRDANRDGTRTGDAIDEGVFGINQHHGYDSPFVEENSAGCLVGRSVAGHRDYMKVLKGDRRYLVGSNYRFWTAVVPGDKI